MLRPRGRLAGVQGNCTEVKGDMQGYAFVACLQAESLGLRISPGRGLQWLAGVARNGQDARSASHLRGSGALCFSVGVMSAGSLDVTSGLRLESTVGETAGLRRNAS